MYTTSTYEDGENINIRDKLKGNDRILFDLLQSIGMSPIIQAVVFDDLEKDSELEDYDAHCQICREQINYDEMHYRSICDNKWLCNICYTNSNITKENFIEYDVCYNRRLYYANPEDKPKIGYESYGGSHEFLTEKFDKGPKNVLWFLSPTRGTNAMAGEASFLYGNVPETQGEFYMNSVIIVDADLYRKKYLIKNKHLLKKSLKDKIPSDLWSSIISKMVDSNITETFNSIYKKRKLSSYKMLDMSGSDV
jgi:hypothetical protein